MHSGAGHDILFGGNGDDTMYGGSGTDTFIFVGGDGNDLIADFRDGTEEIDLTDFGFANYLAFKAATTITAVAGSNGTDARQIESNTGEIQTVDSSSALTITNADLIL
jgi:Ca2+-binding RTX toxin-like protein